MGSDVAETGRLVGALTVESWSRSSSPSSSASAASSASASTKYAAPDELSRMVSIAGMPFTSICTTFSWGLMSWNLPKRTWKPEHLSDPSSCATTRMSIAPESVDWLMLSASEILSPSLATPEVTASERRFIETADSQNPTRPPLARGGGERARERPLCLSTCGRHKDFRRRGA